MTSTDHCRVSIPVDVPTDVAEDIKEGRGSLHLHLHLSGTENGVLLVGNVMVMRGGLHSILEWDLTDTGISFGPVPELETSSKKFGQE